MYNILHFYQNKGLKNILHVIEINCFINGAAIFFGHISKEFVCLSVIIAGSRR